MARRSLLGLIAVCVMCISRVFAQDAPAADPSIGGYSPVSYFTKSTAELGSPEFAVEHEGAIYFLTSAEQVKLFEQEPDKYRPLHKSCPYSLALGMVTPLDPTNFKVIGGSLLLFHKSEEKDALFEWNNSELSEEELLRRAEANANLFKVNL